jgi:hypothetical protein
MRKSLIAALAACAIAAPANAADVMLPPPPAAGIPAPAPSAAPTVAGYVGAYGGVLFSTTGGGVAWAVALDAAVARSMQRMDFQLELRDLTVFAGGSESLAAAIVHAYRRNASSAVGMFGGYEANFGGGSVLNILHLGAEAAMFRSRATLYAQAGAVYLFAGGGSGWGAYLRGVTRFFPRDNVRLEGGVRYLYIVTGGAGSIITPELEAEFQLPGRPLSFVATMRAMIPVGAGGALFTTLGGIRFHFGGGALIDQATPMDTMPLFL